MTDDGVWRYYWVGENRFRQVHNTNNIAAAERKRLDFSYDYLGRRLSKKV